MKESAKPVNYLRCFLAESSAPGFVEEVSESFLTPDPCIVFEFTDIQQAIREGYNEAINQNIPIDNNLEGISQFVRPGLGTVRVFMNLADARALCCHLIHALAGTDDRIAKQLESVVEQAVEDGLEEE